MFHLYVTILSARGICFRDKKQRLVHQDGKEKHHLLLNPMTFKDTGNLEYPQ